MPSGEVYLVTAQGVYRLEGRGLSPAMRSGDPIISASRHGAGNILLGKNSGAVTLFSPGSGEEEALGSLDEPVGHVSSSALGMIYAQSGDGIYLSSDLAYKPVRLTHKARFSVSAGLENPAGIHLSLPVSDFLAPEWFYFAVRPDAGVPAWELDRASPHQLSLDLRGPFSEVSVEALAAARPTDTFLFKRGDRFPFPAVFPEEARPYLLAGKGIPLDLPELQAVLDGIPAEDRQDMLSLLWRLVKDGNLFYQAAYDNSSPAPPSPGDPLAEAGARAAASRVLRGEGGDDYARSLAFTALCRKAGIPARGVLSFDHFFNQVYI
jgi:hypothetical protein